MSRTASSSRALRLVFDPQGEVLAAARDCEAAVFSQWFGNTREQLTAEYDPYEPNSVFVALADGSSEVAACARFLTSGRGRLKTIDDMQRPPWSVDAPRSAAAAGVDLASTWDVATMGVRPGRHSERVRLAFALYHGIITAVRVNNVSAIVAILDEHVRTLLASVGIIMRPLPGTGPQHYLGSAGSAPVFAQVSGSVQRQRRDFPDAYRLITLGVGLDDVQVPARETFRLAPRVAAAAPVPRETLVPRQPVGVSHAELVGTARTR